MARSLYDSIYPDAKRSAAARRAAASRQASADLRARAVRELRAERPSHYPSDAAVAERVAAIRARA